MREERRRGEEVFDLPFRQARCLALHAVSSAELGTRLPNGSSSLFSFSRENDTLWAVPQEVGRRKAHPDPGERRWIERQVRGSEVDATCTRRKRRRRLDPGHFLHGGAVAKRPGAVSLARSGAAPDFLFSPPTRRALAQERRLPTHSCRRRRVQVLRSHFKQQLGPDGGRRRARLNTVSRKGLSEKRWMPGRFAV
ncbi:hypothetical protein SKAU_G00207030 [Synaphobranchus kaupii]|uniref:Uncharacterized protein n=1 Tax=Synaphobranchus kaupii TaxID=118154 RepID=A0A9Q1F8N6_SYNKA|nr:hypothetical protein SKAU_G00207030 [Synaphobranchus kaupii]